MLVNAYSKQRKAISHTNSAVSRQVYVHALLVQHPYSVFFQYMVWYGPTSETTYRRVVQKEIQTEFCLVLADAGIL